MTVTTSPDGYSGDGRITSIHLHFPPGTMPRGLSVGGTVKTDLGDLKVSTVYQDRRGTTVRLVESGEADLTEIAGSLIVSGGGV